MQNDITEIIYRGAHKALFFLLPIFYVLAYAPYSLENNDTGFVLGLAWQLFDGAQLYGDIIYIRPPVSPILHSSVFFAPLGASIFLSKAVFYWQIFLYNWAVVQLLKKYFKSQFVAYFLGCLGFIFCVHNFPAMAWHTVDGIFFSVIGIYFVLAAKRDLSIRLFMGALFLVAAALSKQSFYLVPFAVILFLLTEKSLRRRALIASITMLLAVLSFYFYLDFHGVLGRYIAMTSGQTGIQDLLSIGVFDFVNGMLSKKGLLVLALLPLLLIASIFFKVTKEMLFVIMIAWASLLSFLQYFVADAYTNPGQIFDNFFILACIFVLYLFFFNSQSWLKIALLLLFVSWSASISWGYQTTALFATPFIFVFGLFLLKDYDGNSRAVFAVQSLVLILALVVFFSGYKHPYNLEYKSERSAMKNDLGTIFTSLKYIKCDNKTYDQYSEFRDIYQKYGDNFVVLPNIPLAHAITGTKNPVGTDWPMNAEINNYTDEVFGLLESKNVTVFYLRDAKPSPASPGRYGSEVTVQVLNNWERIETLSYFDVYKKPVR